eukprot:3655893-Pleurochrysis_carterae.AAC.1
MFSLTCRAHLILCAHVCSLACLAVSLPCSTARAGPRAQAHDAAFGVPRRHRREQSAGGDGQRDGAEPRRLLPRLRGQRGRARPAVARAAAAAAQPSRPGPLEAARLRLRVPLAAGGRGVRRGGCAARCGCARRRQGARRRRRPLRAPPLPRACAGLHGACGVRARPGGARFGRAIDTAAKASRRGAQVPSAAAAAGGDGR